MSKLRNLATWNQYGTQECEKILFKGRYFLLSDITSIGVTYPPESTTFGWDEYRFVTFIVYTADVGGSPLLMVTV